MSVDNLSAQGPWRWGERGERGMTGCSNNEGARPFILDHLHQAGGEEDLDFIRRVSKTKRAEKGMAHQYRFQDEEGPHPFQMPTPLEPDLVWSQSGVLLNGRQPMGLWRRSMQRPPWRQDQGGQRVPITPWV